MQTLRAAIALALVLFLGVWGAAAQADGPTVLASTAWTGAIAEAAGAAQVDILASFELRHPPERDFRPGDITRALAADVLLWAGYEGFMNQLIAAAEIPGDRVLQIRTENTPAHLVELTRGLARLWGTEERQAAWEAEFLSVTDEIKAAAEEKNASGRRVIVVGHLAAFAEWLGYDVVATFGFEELTPAALHRLAQLAPDLIIDVWHNPTAEALALAADVPYVLLINFPGHAGTRTLIDVFEYNASQLGLR